VRESGVTVTMSSGRSMTKTFGIVQTQTLFGFPCLPLNELHSYTTYHV